MKIDWDAVTDEAVQYLREYIRIDTTNRPGKERPAADLLEGILEAEGIEVQTFSARPERPNLVCRLQGREDRRGFILLHHMDVVAVERENWSVDPFGGEVRNGFVWGRGALDMKGLGIAELMAFLLVKRHALPLKRDLLYVATPDEETGSTEGAEWLVQNHSEHLEAEWLLNEGGYGWKAGPLSGFHCCIGEKGPLWIRLSAQGRSGHGSMPHEDNACVHLVKALDRIVEYRTPCSIVAEMRPFLERAGIRGDQALERLGEHPLFAEPSISAMFRNTISLTMMRAGQKENVIPSRAEAAIDCRLLPGTERSAFMEELRRVIDDPKIGMEVVMAQEPSLSPSGTRMYRAIEEVLGRHFPGVPVLPILSPGFTDSRCFRKNGVHCYGLLPFLVDREDLASMHGKDERLSIENLGRGVRVIFDLILSLCCE